jgi:hypothetical protein
MAEHQTPGLELDVWMRTFAPSVSQRRQQAVVDRVRSLEDAERVADVDVNYWSTRVCMPDENDAGRRCPRVVTEVLAATSDTGLSLEPHFRQRERAHADADVLFLPVVCLLVRRDGDLRGIYPVTHDGHSDSVGDALDRLEAGERIENIPGDAPRVAPGR